MSVKLELSSDGVISDGNHVQFVPCHIEHDGDAQIQKFFTTYVKEESIEAEDEKEETKELKASFRGYPFSGCVMPVPEGYTGVVLKETRPQVGTEEDRTMRGVCHFKNFTYWNWDRVPSRGDKYQQALDWTAIADVIHGCEK